MPADAESSLVGLSLRPDFPECSLREPKITCVGILLSHAKMAYESILFWPFTLNLQRYGFILRSE